MTRARPRSGLAKSCQFQLNGNDVTDIKKHFGVMVPTARHGGPCPALSEATNAVLINKVEKLKKEYEDIAATNPSGGVQPGIRQALGMAGVTKERAKRTFAATCSDTCVPFAAISKFRQAHYELTAAGVPWPTRQRAQLWVHEERAHQVVE
eukprot:gene8043-1438_t